MVLCQQSTSVQLKMTTERLKEFDFENEIMEQRLHKVLSDVTVLRFPSNISLIYVLYYSIIILCFSYLATWLPFLNKPID